MVYVYHAFSFVLFAYLVPLFLLLVPYGFQQTIRLRFIPKDAVAGFAVSLALLLPFGLYLTGSGHIITFPLPDQLLWQLVGVSLAEEAYFRGFLQHRLGNTAGSVVVVSLLFSLMHTPQLVFDGGLYPLLTFFPSLVMGLLYCWTGNILPSVIFHFLANCTYISYGF